MLSRHIRSTGFKVKTYIESHKVAASKENPEYLVKSEKSGKLAAHKPAALKKV